MRALVLLEGNEVEIIVTRLIQGKRSHIVGHLPGNDARMSVTMDRLIELRCDDEEKKSYETFAEYCKDIIYFVLLAVVILAVLKYLG